MFETHEKKIGQKVSKRVGKSELSRDGWRLDCVKCMGNDISQFAGK